MSDEKPAKLNMDLINMVQNARMLHDKDAVPSKVPGVYWIEAKNPSPPHQITPRTGEFRISSTVDVIDEQWAIIKEATESGKLGYKSKVSTAPTDGAANSKQRMICVRTYDADDTADYERIKTQLVQLGFADFSYQRDNPQS